MSEPTNDRSRREAFGEQPIEIRRYVDALRRSWLLVVVFVIVMTSVAVVVSRELPKTYRSTATIVGGDTVVTLGTSDVDTVKRWLETIRQLMKTNAVLDRAMASVPGQTRDSLSHAVSSSVDPNASIIRVTARSRDAHVAADIANAVAYGLLNTQVATATRGIASARAKLVLQLARLNASGARAAEISAVRDRISELIIAEASIGSDLRLAQAAEPPTKPFTPRPVRNGALAFFAAAFLAVLGVIARAQFRSRVSDYRELAQLMELPVLASIPYVQHRFSRRRSVVSAVAGEAFQTLQVSVQHALEGRGKVVLVTSALPEEGKTTMAVGLARALTHVGKRTLLVSADFRLPTLHSRLGIPKAPGLSDVLRNIAKSNPLPTESELVDQLLQATHVVVTSASESLYVVPSGSLVPNPAALLFGGPLDVLLPAVIQLDYDYVIVDGPPLLGVADGHALAQRADAILIAARLDRLTVEHVLETRETLDRLEAKTLGLVVGIPWRRAHSYGYAYAHTRA
jgi:capsular exopolysaccharide synthesis family protein